MAQKPERLRHIGANKGLTILRLTVEVGNVQAIPFVP